MDTEVRELIEKLETQRREGMELLLTLTDDQLNRPFTDERSTEEGPFTIRRLLHRISTHHTDHIQHILKVRQHRVAPVLHEHQVGSVGGTDRSLPYFVR